MILAILLLGTALVVAVTAVAIISPAKAALGLLAVGTIVVVTFIALAAVTTEPRAPVSGDFPHGQLEADRIMTERMATAVGPGMGSLMTIDGMLERSANDAYVRALEQHAYQVDRMLGRAP